MPINKNAYLRYMLLEQLLTTKPFTKEELLERLNEALENHESAKIKPDQLNKDLSALKNKFRIEISMKKSDNKAAFPTKPKYSYADRDIRLFQGIRKLSKGEMEEIDFAVDILKGKGNLALVQNAMSIINSVVKNISNTLAGDKVLFDSASEVKGTEYITHLYKAIKNEEVLSIEYIKLGETELRKYIFHPYILREYKGKWYVIGYRPSDEPGRTFTLVLDLSCIQDIKPANLSFFTDTKFNAKTYFEHSIGIFHHHFREPKNVRFWMQKKYYPHLEIRSLHSTQRPVERKQLNGVDGTIVELNVILSPELEEILIGFADKIKVLGPKELVENIKERLSKMNEYYK